jgi:hypothetical protein
MKIFGLDQKAFTAGSGIIDFFLAGASLAAQPNLDNGGDMGHLGRSAHGTAETLADTIAFIHPIQVRINLNDAQIFDICIGL